MDHEHSAPVPSADALPYEQERVCAEALHSRLHKLPGGSELLELAATREDVELVGGAVRDLLLGRTPRELDLALDSDAPLFANELAARLGALARVNEHERFGTVQVEWDAGRIDLANRRAEFYPTPGALPEVRPGTPDEDLRRRDFTVNAIAIALGGPRLGAMRHAPNALEDLSAGLLRVLHNLSFIEDPTRLLRLARYRARLSFAVEEHTAELARAALAEDNALQALSGARVGAELRLALAEPQPIAALAELDRLGVLHALHPALHFDEQVARDALELLPEDGRTDLLLLASLLLGIAAQEGPETREGFAARAGSETPDGSAAQEDPETAIYELLNRWEFPAADRDRVCRSALTASHLADAMGTTELCSDLYELVCREPLEAVALGGGLGAQEPLSFSSGAAGHWLTELRHVRLQITGDHLLAAGVPAGPEIGRRLQAALYERLDGDLPEDPDAELRVALDATW
jgi:tRNA nucleotidyltransferase (CCA-adding enzyme)